MTVYRYYETILSHKYIINQQGGYTMTNEPSNEKTRAYQRYLEVARQKICTARGGTDYNTILEACEGAQEYIGYANEIIPNDGNIEERFTDAENIELAELLKKGNLLYANELWKEIAQIPKPKNWPGTYRKQSIGICLQVLKDAGIEAKKEILKELNITPEAYTQIINLSEEEERQQ